MNEHSPCELMKRLSALEHRLVRWQRGTLMILLVALAGTLTALASEPNKVVVAQRFVLKDSSGTIRAVLGNAGNRPEEGDAPASSPVSILGGWGLHLYNANNEVVRLVDGWLAVTPEKGDGGGFYVSVSDKTALVQMVIPGKRKKELRLQLNPEYGTNISLKSGNATRAVLGEVDLVNSRIETTEHRPLSSLVLFGKDGKAVAALPR